MREFQNKKIEMLMVMIHPKENHKARAEKKIGITKKIIKQGRKKKME